MIHLLLDDCCDAMGALQRPIPPEIQLCFCYMNLCLPCAFNLKGDIKNLQIIPVNCNYFLNIHYQKMNVPINPMQRREISLNPPDGGVSVI